MAVSGEKRCSSAVRPWTGQSSETESGMRVPPAFSLRSPVVTAWPAARAAASANFAIDLMPPPVSPPTEHTASRESTVSAYQLPALLTIERKATKHHRRVIRRLAGDLWAEPWQRGR